MINLGLGEGPGPSVVSGRCFPSTLSHVIHRAFHTEGESFCFFLANMQPSSVSTISICCCICCALLSCRSRGHVLWVFWDLATMAPFAL